MNNGNDSRYPGLVLSATIIGDDTLSGNDIDGDGIHDHIDAYRNGGADTNFDGVLENPLLDSLEIAAIEGFSPKCTPLTVTG